MDLIPLVGLIKDVSMQQNKDIYIIGPTFLMSPWPYYAVSVPDTIYEANMLKTSHNPVRYKEEKRIINWSMSGIYVSLSSYPAFIEFAFPFLCS